MNDNVHPIFKGILDSLTPKPKSEVNPLVKMAIKAHTNAVLSGKYPYLHMTPESESNFCVGWLAGFEEAITDWDKNLKVLQECVDSPTVSIQDKN